MTINPTTGAISWTPAETDGPGVYTIQVAVAAFQPPGGLKPVQDLPIMRNDQEMEALDGVESVDSCLGGVEQ